MNIQLESGKSLDLPYDLELNVIQSNPLLLEQGSYSLPVLLPNTKTNVRELDNPDRLDRKYKLKTKIRSYVSHGAFQKIASLNILSAGPEGIDTTFLLNESEMYVKMKETTMSTAFDVKRQATEFLPDMVFDDPLDRLIKYLELVMVGNFNDDFWLFPIATDYKDEIRTTRHGDVTYRTFQGLNQPDGVVDLDLNGVKYGRLEGHDARTIIIDDKAVSVTKGYGITPFLKQTYVIRRIFAYFGYKLNQSLLDTDPDLSTIVVPNNTADSIIDSRIDYAQLVPDCTIDEYLQTVRTDYGCEFFISTDHRSVDVKFWNDIVDLKKNTINDLNDKITERPVTEFVVPKTLKLNYNRSIEFSEIPFDTLEKLERNFGEMKYIDYMPNDVFEPISIADGIYYIKNLAMIWQLTTELSVRKWKFLTSPLFDFYTDLENAEFDEKDTKKDYLPYEYGHYPDRTLFIGKRRHMNSRLQTVTTNEAGIVETVDIKETAVKCPITTAFYRLSTIDNFATPAGTIFQYDENGVSVGNLNLVPGGKNGLYEHFWVRYDEILQHSFNMVSVTLNLSESEIIGYRMDEIYFIANQPLLPETLEYIISEHSIKINKATFRTIRLYADRTS